MRLGRGWRAGSGRFAPGLGLSEAAGALKPPVRLKRTRFVLQPSQPGEVVGEVGQRDLCRRPSETDGVDHQLEAAFLGGEHVLHLGADLRPGGVAASDVRRHRLAPGLRQLELRKQPAVFRGSPGWPANGRR